MKKIIFAISIFPLLSGCSDSIESICQETSKILKEQTGQGFTDVGMLGCLKQSPEAAKQDQEALKKMTAQTQHETTTISRTDAITAVKGKNIEGVISMFGEPDMAFLWLPKQPNESLEELKERQNKLTKEQIIEKSIANEPGNYSYSWKKPITHNLFGKVDGGLGITLRIEQQQPPELSISFPPYCISNLFCWNWDI